MPNELLKLLEDIGSRNNRSSKLYDNTKTEILVSYKYKLDEVKTNRKDRQNHS